MSKNLMNIFYFSWLFSTLNLWGVMSKLLIFQHIQEVWRRYPIKWHNIIEFTNFFWFYVVEWHTMGMLDILFHTTWHSLLMCSVWHDFSDEHLLPDKEWCFVKEALVFCSWIWAHLILKFNKKTEKDELAYWIHTNFWTVLSTFQVFYHTNILKFWRFTGQ